MTVIAKHLLPDNAVVGANGELSIGGCLLTDVAAEFGTPVFVYDEDDHDIGWLVGIAQQVEVIIIDVDNCDAITSQFITFLLAHPNSYYITNDDTIPYKLISKNRIYNLDWIIEKIKQDEDDADAEED